MHQENSSGSSYSHSIKQISTVFRKPVQTWEGPFRCTPCGKEFKLIYNFKSHMKFVHQVELSSTSQLEREPNDDREDASPSTHAPPTPTNSESFSCKVCSRSFPTVKALTLHGKLHEKNKVPTCDLCNRTFTHHISLVRHNFLHHKFSKPRPFLCNMCGERFVRKENLEKHQIESVCNSVALPQISQRSLTSARDRYKNYRCRVCGRGYSYDGNLANHLRLVHGQE